MTEDRLDPIRDALRSNIDGLARDLLGEPSREFSNKRELRWGNKGGLRVHISGPKKGGWSDFNGEEKGDPFALIRHVRGCSFPAAVDFAKRFTGLEETSDTDREADAHARALREREREQHRAEAEAEQATQDAKRIATAQALAAESVPADGTLACFYMRQVRGIPRPLAGWPQAVRFHARYRALLVVGTTADGTVQTVQRVHLDAAGEKVGPEELRRRKLVAVKVSNGPMAGAVVRLPGAADGPLLLAEGPETALAAWASTGHETWITLGGVSKAQPPAGRPIVVCRDDDARHSKGDTSHAATVAAWRKTGLDIRVATPWATRQGDKSDLATVILRDGADPVAARIALALSRAPATIVKRVPLAEARNQVAAAVGAFFDRVEKLSVVRAEWDAQVQAAKEPRPAAEAEEARPVLTREQEADAWDEALAAAASAGPTAPNTFTHAIRVDVGVGKSHEARAGIARTLAAMRARGDDRTMVLAVPAHALGDEQAATFLALPEVVAAELRVAVWRGRGAPDPDHPDYRNAALPREQKATMCGDLERVLDAQSIGLPAQNTVCTRKLDGRTVRCPLFDGCSYQRQQKREADLWIMSHDMLFHAKPETMGEVAAVVVDEAVWRKGLAGAEGRPLSMSLGTFEQDFTILFGKTGMVDHHSGNRLRDLRRQLAELFAGLPDGPLHRDQLARTSLTADSCVEAFDLEYRRKVNPLHPGQSKDQRKEAIAAAEGNRTVARMGMLWDALRVMLSPNAPTASGWIELGEEPTKLGPVPVVRLKGRSKVKEGWKAPVLLLDALLPVDLVRPFWPDVELVADVRAAMPHQHIRQVTDKAFALSMLEPLGEEAAKADPQKAQRRANRLRDLRAFLIREAQRHAPGRMLVVLQQAIEKALHASGPLPSNLETAHHNNIAGRDEWRDVASVIVVGRTLPPPSGVERIAEALTGTAIAKPLDWYERGDAVREMVDGSTVPAEAETHMDPLAETVRWQICEGELVQINGRGRGVNRTADNPLEILVLTDAPLPMPLAGVLGAKELDPSPAELMMAAGGVVFANARHAVTAYPNLWPNHEAAAKAFQRARSPTNPYRESYIRKCRTPQPATYQLAGRGSKAAEAWFCPDLCPDPAAFLAEKLGPLAWVKIEGEGGPPDPPPGAGVKAGEAGLVENFPQVEATAEAPNPMPPADDTPEPGHPALDDPPPDAGWDGRWVDAAPPLGWEPHPYDLLDVDDLQNFPAPGTFLPPVYRGLGHGPAPPGAD